MSTPTPKPKPATPDNPLALPDADLRVDAYRRGEHVHVDFHRGGMTVGARLDPAAARKLARALGDAAKPTPKPE